MDDPQIQEQAETPNAESVSKAAVPHEPQIQNLEPFAAPPESYEQTGRTYAVINQKGGCGKTTTAVNLGAALAIEKFQVLLIDLDPQANATLGLGFRLESEEKTVYDLFKNPSLPFSDLIRPTYQANLHMIPSSSLLSPLAADLLKMTNWEYILRSYLRPFRQSYHFILIDCPPALNAIAINALTASQNMIIPLQTHYYALEGRKELFLTARLVREKLNPLLKNGKILATLYDKRTKINREMLEGIRNYFKDQVCDTVIRINVKLIEAVMHGESVLTYAPDSRGAEDYRALARELILEESRLKQQPVFA
jgi:chromosome partitioning protein